MLFVALRVLGCLGFRVMENEALGSTRLWSASSADDEVNGVAGIQETFSD